MNPEDEKMLLAGAEFLGLEISPANVRSFSAYLDELLHWNAHINLTAAKSPLEIIEKHFLDSAVLTRFLPVAASAADIGSGAGFPGIVIKIFHPDMNLALVERSAKKASFLKHMRRTLGLGNTEVICASIGKRNAGALSPYDFLVTRAVKKIDDLFRFASSILGKEQVFIAMTGKIDAGDQVLASPLSGKKKISIFRQETYCLPFCGARRTLLFLRAS